MMSLRPMARSVPPFTPLSTFLRSNSTASSSTPTPTRPPPRAPVVPTTFSEKASPKNVHQRPEQIRGFPPMTKKPEWETARSTASSSNADPEAFNGPSRPRLMYERPRRRELPEIKNRVPIIVALTLLGLGAWGSFLLYATNAERLASSVMRSLQFHLRNSSEVAALLGRRVKLEEPWYILGDPWISGSVNTMQGRVDLSFRVTGDHDAGTIYFTSIRPSQADPWRIVRYKLITDSGETLRLEESIGKI